ncbi:MAG: hypothetical protein AAGA80_05610 [Cyanobacteria bacterium P01_F01_bin.143]
MNNNSNQNKLQLEKTEKLKKLDLEELEKVSGGPRRMVIPAIASPSFY